MLPYHRKREMTFITTHPTVFKSARTRLEVEVVALALLTISMLTALLISISEGSNEHTGYCFAGRGCCRGCFKLRWSPG